MTTPTGKRLRGLLLSLTVVSLMVTPVSGVVWAGEGTSTGASSSPLIEDTQKQCPCDDSGSLYDEIDERNVRETTRLGLNADGQEADVDREYDFGRVTAGSNVTRDLVFPDIETGTVTDVTITGDDAGAFRVTAADVSSIEPGEPERVRVTFAPDGDGTHRAILRLERADSGPVLVGLSGTGTAPDIEVDRDTLRFANATDETTAETLTLTNNGSAPLTVEALRLVGPDRTVFEPDDSGPFTIEPDQSREVVVRFDQPEPEARFATMHILSDDPQQPQRNVWLTNTPTVADVSPSHVEADRTHVNTSVVDAQPNTTQSINISWPATRDDTVAIDALTYTSERGGDFTINVTKSDEQFEGTPTFSSGDGTEEVAFVSMDSTISNEDIRDVTITFRVSKDRLAGDEDPEDVTLYTHQNEQWVELPTTVVDEGPTHYFFETKSPGLLDFATGIKQAQFRIDDAVVSVTEIRIGESVDVSVRVTNVGGADGTYTVRLIRDDSVVDRRDLSIATGGSRQMIFTESFDEPGTYELYVNDHFAGTVTVNESGTTTAMNFDVNPNA